MCDCLTLRMKSLRFSERSQLIHLFRRRNVPTDSKLQNFVKWHNVSPIVHKYVFLSHSTFKCTREFRGEICNSCMVFHAYNLYTAWNAEMLTWRWIKEEEKCIPIYFKKLYFHIFWLRDCALKIISFREGREFWKSEASVLHFSNSESHYARNKTTAPIFHTLLWNDYSAINFPGKSSHLFRI